MDIEFILNSISPEEVFSFNNIEGEFRELVKQYHPDVNPHPQTGKVIEKIISLYREGLRRKKEGLWGTSRNSVILHISSKKIVYKYYETYEMEIGKVFIGKSSLLFCIKDEFVDLRNNASFVLSSFTYDTEGMREEFAHRFPPIVPFSPPSYFILQKPFSYVRLRDVVNYYKGELHPKSTAWIISNLYNLLCFFFHNKYIHGDISLDSIYIEPQAHTLFLSSYFYGSFGDNKKFAALPERTIDYCNYLQRNGYVRDFRVDGDLLRLVGSELNNKNTPLPMKKYFNSPASGNIYEEYKIWMNEVLPSSFGERKFFEMDTSAKLIYSKGE